MRRAAGPKGPGWPKALEAVYRDEERVLNSASSYEARAEVQLRKWRILHRHLRDHPFEVSESLPRAEQWRRVLDHVKRSLGERDVIDWVILQREVAANLAAGIQDLRPRKNGPCHALLLEFVADRKRKALAVLRWTRGKNVPLRPSFPPAGGKSG